MENIVEREFKQTGEILTDIVCDFFKRVIQDPKGIGIEVKEFENSDTRLSLLKRDDRTIAGVVETRTEFNNVEFIKFSLYKDHPTTASGSVAATKEKRSINDQFKIDNYKTVENRLLSANSDIKQLESENTALREALKELLKFADMYLHSKVLEYARGNFEKSELEDSAAIIERARKLLNP